MTVYAPPLAPNTLDETGVGHRLLFDLIVKMMHVQGLATVSALANRTKLPPALVGELIDEAREMAIVQTLGSRGAGLGSELRFDLTNKGHEWAIDALKRSQYMGPAPVSLDAYRAQVEGQRLTHETIHDEDLQRSFGHLVLPDDLLQRLGPAINSAKSMLLYGRSGNGKTAIAESLRDALKDTIAVPYCIEVDGQIISFYDEHVHGPLPEEEASSGLRTRERPDRRWIPCRRPVSVVGGELTLDMLELGYNPNAGFYEAPAQMKVTNGIFLIDDFGRQRTTPASILNRWIVPLERGIDYLALNTGRKIQVPFDELVIFSTNLTPSDVADEAMLRRLYYKIEVPIPTAEDYARIWQMLCRARGVHLPDDVVPFLERTYYASGRYPRAGYQPRYLLDQVAAICQYLKQPLRLDTHLLSLAWKNLFATDPNAGGVTVRLPERHLEGVG